MTTLDAARHVGVSVESCQFLVTVSVPVHNGGVEFERCLERLRTQTLRDFRVLIFENGSTDGTLGIAKKFVAMDRRFELCASEKLLPVMENFHRAVEIAARASRYVCLRAADDYTSENYLECLVSSLEQNPNCHLAVAKSVKVRKDGVEVGQRFGLIEKILDRSRMANWTIRFPATWYYGIYRVGPATDYLLRSRELCPYVWGFDRLVIYKMLTDFAVVYCDEALFYCQVGSDGANKYRARTFFDALARRLSYYHACMEMEAHRKAAGVLGAARSRWIAWRVAGEHTATGLKHMAKLALKSLGLR